MTQYLPPNLLALFAARDPLPYLQPADKLPHEKKRVPYFGVGQFLDDFEFVRCLGQPKALMKQILQQLQSTASYPA